MSTHSDEQKEKDNDARNAVLQITQQTPQLTDMNFVEWKQAIKIAKFVRRWEDEVFVASKDQSKEDPNSPLFAQRLILWQVILLTTRDNFRYLTNQVEFGDSGKAWLQITSHFERQNAQFVRGLTTKFFSLTMINTGLALKQFANRVVTD